MTRTVSNIPLILEDQDKLSNLDMARQFQQWAKDAESWRLERIKEGTLIFGSQDERDISKKIGQLFEQSDHYAEKAIDDILAKIPQEADDNLEKLIHNLNQAIEKIRNIKNFLEGLAIGVEFAVSLGKAINSGDFGSIPDSLRKFLGDIEVVRNREKEERERRENRLS